MKLTHQIIHSAGTAGIGFNYQQLRILGVKWPPRKGWLSKLIGTEIPADKWELVVRLKGVRNKKARKDIVHSREQASLPIKPAPETNPTAEILSRIQNYLGNGGLFNPEMMEHDKVRELILDCRDEINRLNTK